MKALFFMPEDLFLLIRYIKMKSGKVFVSNLPQFMKLSMHKLKNCSDFLQSLRVNVF